MLTITPLTGPDQPVLAPDVVLIDGTYGDLVFDAAGELMARNPISTAALLLLGTDARCSDDELLPEHAGDARGWVGDGFDVDAARGEAPLGAKFWLYRRAHLTDETGRQVEDEARRALKPLLDQGVVARIEAKATVQKAEGRLVLAIALIGRDGRTITDIRFDPLWKLV